MQSVLADTGRQQSLGYEICADNVSITDFLHIRTTDSG
jgi:hypothetical protein